MIATAARSCAWGSCSLRSAGCSRRRPAAVRARRVRARPRAHQHHLLRPAPGLRRPRRHVPRSRGLVHLRRRRPGELSDLRVVIKTDSVFTNHERRDEHLRSADFLNVEAFPEMVFEGRSAEPLTETTGRVTGDLTLRGVTRPVTLDVTAQQGRALSVPRRALRDRRRCHRHDQRSDFGMTYGSEWVGDDDPDRPRLRGDPSGVDHAWTPKRLPARGSWASFGAVMHTRTGEDGMRPNRLRQIWQDGGAAVNGWLQLPHGFAAEVMAAQGWDSLTIDMQHGPVGYDVALTMLQALSSSDVTPLARVPWNEPGIIMKMLDAGCYGIICPMINIGRGGAALRRRLPLSAQGLPQLRPDPGQLLRRRRLRPARQRHGDRARDDRDRPGDRESRRDPRHPGPRWGLRRPRRPQPEPGLPGAGRSSSIPTWWRCSTRSTKAASGAA